MMNTTVSLFRIILFINSIVLNGSFLLFFRFAVACLCSVNRRYTQIKRTIDIDVETSWWGIIRCQTADHGIQRSEFTHQNDNVKRENFMLAPNYYINAFYLIFASRNFTISIETCVYMLNFYGLFYEIFIQMWTRILVYFKCFLIYLILRFPLVAAQSSPLIVVLSLLLFFCTMASNID